MAEVSGHPTTGYDPNISPAQTWGEGGQAGKVSGHLESRSPGFPAKPRRARKEAGKPFKALAGEIIKDFINKGCHSGLKTPSSSSLKLLEPSDRKCLPVLAATIMGQGVASGPTCSEQATPGVMGGKPPETGRGGDARPGEAALWGQAGAQLNLGGRMVLTGGPRPLDTSVGRLRAVRPRAAHPGACGVLSSGLLCPALSLAVRIQFVTDLQK